MAPEQQVSGEESYVSKLSLKTLGCNPKAVCALPDGNPMPKIAIARIYGMASQMGKKEDVETGKVYNFLRGNFEGINMQDGTVLRSATLYLPGGIQEVIENLLEKIRNDGDKDDVGFAFEIRSVKATNKAGYSYEAAALKDPHKEDILAGMRNAIANLPTLEQRKELAAGKTTGGSASKTLEGSATPSRKSA